MATSSKDKMNVKKSNCLICDNITGVSTRNAISISQRRVTSSYRTVVKVIDDVFGVPLSSYDLHSDVVCHQCYKILNEVDEMEDRLAGIKSKFSNQYQRTLKSKSNGIDVLIVDTNDIEQEGDTPKPVSN